MGREPRPDQTTWRSRRTLAWTVRAANVVVPFVASIVAMALASRLVARPSGSTMLFWYAGLFAVSLATMLVVRRVVRRLIPLAALLDMSLEFPELAPSRLSLARKAHSTRDLAELMNAATDETTQQAAERVLMLLTALAEHDRGTRGHAERVRAYTDLLATRMGLSAREADRLRWASLLHDIGKLHVPQALLTKPSKPTATEWETLRAHPSEGARIAAPLLPWLGEFGAVIEQHHERFDGTGYPNGLAGNAICRGARIVAVADTFEVITAPRPYKRPIKREAALEELVRCSGSQFDPDVVRAFLAVDSKRLMWAMGPTSWLAGLPFVGQAPAPLMTAITNQTMNLTTAAVVGAVSAASVAVAGPVLASSHPPAVTDHDGPGRTETAAPAEDATTETAPDTARDTPASPDTNTPAGGFGPTGIPPVPEQRSAGTPPDTAPVGATATATVAPTTPVPHQRVPDTAATSEPPATSRPTRTPPRPTSATSRPTEKPGSASPADGSTAPAPPAKPSTPSSTSSGTTAPKPAPSTGSGNGGPGNSGKDRDDKNGPGSSQGHH